MPQINSKKVSVTSLAMQWGFIGTAGMILYFLLMYALNLTHITELRALNLFIQGGVVIAALNRLRKSKGGQLPYLQGFGLGALTGIINALSFGVFMVLFLAGIDPEFMEYIKENEPMGIYLTPVLAGGAVFMEGMFASFLLAFVFMQYFKSSRMSKKPEDTGHITNHV